MIIKTDFNKIHLIFNKKSNSHKKYLDLSSHIVLRRIFLHFTNPYNQKRFTSKGTGCLITEEHASHSRT